MLVILDSSRFHMHVAHLYGTSCLFGFMILHATKMFWSSPGLQHISLLLHQSLEMLQRRHQLLGFHEDSFEDLGIDHPLRPEGGAGERKRPPNMAVRWIQLPRPRRLNSFELAILQLVF